MGAKIRKYPEKSKIRVNICKKKAKDLFEQQKMSIFATSKATI